MNLTPQQAHRDLVNAQTILDGLARRIPGAIHAARQAINTPELVDDKPKAESTGRRKGWISDPTADRAIGITIREERHLELLEAQLASLLLTLSLLTQFAEKWSPVLGERARCNGGRTVDEWSNPNCTNWADTYFHADGKEAVRGDGLCSACRKRRDRHERQSA